MTVFLNDDDFAQQGLECLRQAVAEALERKRKLGQYAVFWRDGRVVYEGPDAPEQPEQEEYPEHPETSGKPDQPDLNDDDFAQQGLECLRQAVAEALERKRKLDQYAVFWRDGRVVYEGPDAPEQPECSRMRRSYKNIWYRNHVS